MGNVITPKANNLAWGLSLAVHYFSDKHAFMPTNSFRNITVCLAGTVPQPINPLNDYPKRAS